MRSRPDRVSGTTSHITVRRIDGRFPRLIPSPRRAPRILLQEGGAVNRSRLLRPTREARRFAASQSRPGPSDPAESLVRKSTCRATCRRTLTS